MKFFLSIAIALLTAFSTLTGQSVDVPIDVQVPIMVRMLSLERNLVKKINSKSSLNIGIIYQSKFRSSLVSKESFEKSLNSQDIKFAKNVNILSQEYTDNEDLAAWMKKSNIDVLVIAPLRAVDIKNITKATQSSKVLSYSIVSEYTDFGVSLSIETKSDKPQIVINLKSAKLEGSDFNSHLLKLARLIDN